MALKVDHCRKTMEFFVKMNSDSARAVLQYRELPNKTLDFHHTEVPSEFQGRGVAAQLVKEGLKYAIDNKYNVIPSCSYVSKYVREKGTAEEKAISHL